MINRIIFIITFIQLYIKDIIKSFSKLTINPVDLSGKVILISGGNEGIGLETAIKLAKMNAKIIIASRNLKKSELAVEKIKQLSHNSDIHYRQLDLGSIQSVNQFSEKFKLEFPVLDILINNAGLVTFDYSKTEDDLERIFHINYIGQSQLTLNLLPILLKSESPRIINVSSKMHQLARLQLPNDFNIDPLNFKGIPEYNKSKLMTILFTNELARQLKDKPIKVVSLHPGFIYTKFGQNDKASSFTKSIVLSGVQFMRCYFGRRPDQGAMTTVYCAIDDSILNGQYYDSCKVSEISLQAKDCELAKDLWARTLDILKIDKDYVSKL